MNQPNQHGFKVGDRVEGYDGNKDRTIKPSLIGQTGTVTGFGKVNMPGLEGNGGLRALAMLIIGDELERDYVQVKMDNPSFAATNGGIMHFAPYHIRKLEPDQDVPEHALDEKEAWAALEKSLGFDLRKGVPERVQ